MLPVLVLLFGLVAQAPAHPAVDRAEAALEAVGGSGATGTARLQRFDAGTRVVIQVRGLEDGLHGLAVVDAVSCAEADAPHLDRHGRPHGDPEDPRPLHHDGDLGNVRVRDGGAGRHDRIYTDLPMDGEASAVGRLLVVYAGQDDLNTQPRGGSGEPVACGVIRAGGRDA